MYTKAMFIKAMLTKVIFINKKSALILFLSVFLFACASERIIDKTSNQQTSHAADEKEFEYPAYQGYPRRVMVFPWNISKVDLEKYPHFRNLQIGFGISNRLLDELFGSGQFELIEEKQVVMARMLQQMQQCTTGLCDANYAPLARLPKPQYIVYPEVYHVGVEKNVSISGLSAKAKLQTEIGVQINFVDTKTGITRALGSAIGSFPNTLKSTILSNPKIEFSQSALGKAAKKAIQKALLKSMRNLPVLHEAPEPIQIDSISPVYLANKKQEIKQKNTVLANNKVRNQSLLASKIESGKNKESKKIFSNSNYHALVIGNNNYKYVSKLITAVNDANGVASVLEKKYGFKAHVLHNASRQQIIAKLDKLRKNLKKDDKLLIYYAGHGYFDKEADRGYWLPVNASTENTAEWISNTDITDKVKAMLSNHVIVISDSCYSGTLTRGLVIDISPQETLSDYHRRMMQKRSRTVMSSGGLEPVADGGRDNHSVFAGAFLDALNDNENVMDGMEFFNQVRKRVTLDAEQTPEYSDIRFAGHRGGDFLFIRKN